MWMYLYFILAIFSTIRAFQLCDKKTHKDSDTIDIVLSVFLYYILGPFSVLMDIVEHWQKDRKKEEKKEIPDS